MLSHAEQLHRLRLVLDSAGVHETLQLLNSYQRRRFTALYVFEGHSLHNEYLVDREQPGRRTFDDIPVMASYCVFVRDTGAPFVVEDAPADERVRDHPKRDLVRSYCGVPLLNDMGIAYGSLCHFDMESASPADEGEVELLQELGLILYAKIASAV